MFRRYLSLLLIIGIYPGCDTSSVISDKAPAVKAPPPPAEPAPPPEMVQEKAEVGVGVKGNDLGAGLVSTPVKAYFQAKERIVFEIQIPQAMKLYEATNDRKPQSHEEFMEQIIKFNAIPLPQLPPNSRYIYDPATGELMVEHPKRN
jgi:hypothetical protein